MKVCVIIYHNAATSVTSNWGVLSDKKEADDLVTKANLIDPSYSYFSYEEFEVDKTTPLTEIYSTDQ